MSEPEVGVGRTIIPGQGERWSVTRGVYQLGPDVDNSRAKFNIIAHTSPYTYPSDLALSKQEGTRIVSLLRDCDSRDIPGRTDILGQLRVYQQKRKSIGCESKLTPKGWLCSLPTIHIILSTDVVRPLLEGKLI